MLYLDFGVYEPTRIALEHFLPLMPQGAVLHSMNSARRRVPAKRRQRLIPLVCETYEFGGFRTPLRYRTRVVKFLKRTQVLITLA